MGIPREAAARLAEASTDTMRWARKIVTSVLDSFGERRRARLEAELDQKQDELRRTILNIAEALGAEGYEARKALIRESYLASGSVPHRPE